MPRVMIRCPDTGDPSPTIMMVAQRAFDAGRIVNIPIRDCASCGTRHDWHLEDAFLEFVDLLVDESARHVQADRLEQLIGQEVTLKLNTRDTTEAEIVGQLLDAVKSVIGVAARIAPKDARLGEHLTIHYYYIKNVEAAK